MDSKKIEQAVKLMLEAMGEDAEREGLKDTPSRVARAFEEVFAGYADDEKKHLSVTFEGGSGGLVLEKDIPVYSVCEHHMLPFFGRAHVAYIPGGRVAGLSKIARTVEVFARRLQLQERLTEQVARALWENLSPQGVMVVIEAEHTCMTMRGIKKTGSKTITCSKLGAFEKDAALCGRIMEMIGNEHISSFSSH